MDREAYNDMIDSETTTLLIHHMTVATSYILRRPHLIKKAIARIELDIEVFTEIGQEDEIPKSVLSVKDVLESMQRDLNSQLQ